jgi:GTP cyclohydrolase I
MKSRRKISDDRIEQLESANTALRGVKADMQLEIERLAAIVEASAPPPPRVLNLQALEEGVERLLEGMGVDTADPDFLDTPRRVAKMYAELLTPEANNWATFPGGEYDEVILLRGHKLFGLCPHHLLPVIMRAYVAYIPQKRVLGLSKLARACEQHLTKPIKQEELTRAICDELWDRLEPKAAGVIIAGQHTCMTLRGVETDGDVVTSAMKGAFLLNAAARTELLTLIGKP